MRAQTAVRQARGMGCDLPARFVDTFCDDKIASALALLRKPVSIVSILALTVTFSAVAFLRYGWTLELFAHVPLFTVLSVITVLDLRTKIIPDVITLPAIVYALAAAAVMGSPSLSEAMLGATAAGGVVLLLAVISRGAFGGGDIKLMAMLGAALGWKAALLVLALSQVAAAFVALGLLIARRARTGDPLPVGAIISVLGAIMLLGATWKG